MREQFIVSTSVFRCDITPKDNTRLLAAVDFTMLDPGKCLLSITGRHGSSPVMLSNLLSAAMLLHTDSPGTVANSLFSCITR